MTPRAEAWIRQAHNDLDAARCMAAEAFHAQACYLAGQAALHLKPLTRMNSDTRYPQGDEAPADLFDANDSQAALATAEAVLRIATAELRS
jgi:HEPN domain-containing protein